jgi:PAS domain S-box-containing protein
MSQPNAVSPTRLAFGACAMAAAAAIGLLALWLSLGPVAFFGAAFVEMPAVAAAAIVLASAAWFALQFGGERTRLIGSCLSAVVGLIGAAALAQRIVGADLGIEQLVLRDGALASGDHPAQLGVALSVALLLASATLVLCRSSSEWAENARQSARLGGVAIPLLALALYASDPAAMQVIWGFEGLTPGAAFALTLLFLGVGLVRSAVSLRWQVAYIGVAVIAPLAAATVHFASSEREIALQHAAARLSSVARLGVERQDASIALAQDTLAFLARSPVVQQTGPECDALLSSFLSLNPWMRSLFVVDRAGKVRCADRPEVMSVNLADRQYLRTAFATQRFSVSGFVLSRLNDEPRIAAALPTPEGDLAIGTALDLTVVGEPLARLATEGDPRTTMTLVDQAGLIIARHPAHDSAAGADLAKATFVARALSAPDAPFEASELDGSPMLFSARRLAFGGGTLIVGLPKQAVTAAVDQRLNHRLLLIGLILLGSVAVAVAGVEMLILRPLRRLTAYAGRLEAGELDARPEVSARGEVGALGGALAATACAIQERERRLANTEALFRGLFDHSPDSKAVVRIEPDGAFRIETWNAAAVLASGLSPAEVLGRTPLELFPGPRGEAIERDLRRTLTLGTVFTAEREPTINGLPTVYEMVQVPLRNAHGEIERIFLSARDISERKRVERLKNEFVSTVSHELRTPLTSIAGSLGLLAGGAAGPLGDKARHLIGIAHSNSLRLVRLINDILDIEKIESGRMSFDLRPLVVADLVEQAIGGMKAYADEFEVELDAPSVDPSLTVLGDADRLTQVITNLLSNAIKFSPRGGVATVSTRTEGDILAIGVKDRGPGIPESFRSRIFTKFAQADGSDSRRKGGTGLGLAIVREIVDRHAGAVSYRSDPGEGTEFEVRLPLHSVRERAPTTFFSGAARRPRVLVCEDDPFVATILAEQMSDAGFEGVPVGSVREALRVAASEPVDAVLVDLNLPDGDGISMIRELRSLEKTRLVPIVVVSAEAERGKADARAAMLDVVAWLEKPIDGGRLAGLLRQRLGTRPGRTRVLHVEDDADLCNVISAAVSPIADVVSVGSLQAAREKIGEGPFDLAIVDVTLEDGSGLDLLIMLEKHGPTGIPVVIFSAHDIDRDVAAKVQAALTKSRTSLSALVDTVRRLVEPRDQAPAEPVRTARSRGA